VAANPQEFLSRARLLAEKGHGWSRAELKKEWEHLQRQYLPSLWSWPLSITVEVEQLEARMNKLIKTRKR